MYPKFDASCVDWFSAFRRLGLHEDFLNKPTVSKPCPLHPSNGSTKFRFLKPIDRGRWVCNDCGIFGPVDLLMKMHGWDFKTTMRELEGMGVISPTRITHQETPAEAAKAAAKVKRDFDQMKRWWRQSAPIESTNNAARHYLERRITDVQLDGLGAELRCHPRMPYFEAQDKKRKAPDYFPALLGLFRDAAGNIKMMHRIYVTPDGLKAPVAEQKKMFCPRWVNGCAIRIGQQKDSPVIGVAEGIEKAIAIYRACGEKMPIWAAGTAHGVETLEVPLGIERVHIFADHNLPTEQHPKGRGQHAAEKLRSRLVDRGIEVIVHVAKTVNGDHEDDWNLLAAQKRVA